jgi:hypothetical protein
MGGRCDFDAVMTMASAAVLVVALMGGCEAEGRDVPSLTGEGGSVVEANQAQTGEAYYECLIAAQIPARIVHRPDGYVYVTLDTEEHAVMWSAPGEHGSTENISTDEASAWQAGHQGAYGVVVDGVDRSASFKECRTSIAYTEPWRSEETGFRRAQVMAEITNTWTACAREEGFPTLPDVTATKSDDSWPQVELPIETDPAALRALLAACPPARVEDMHLADELGMAQIPSAQVVFAGESELAEPDPEGTSEVSQHLEELRAIYSEAVGAVYDEWVEQTTEAGAQTPGR